MAMLETLEMWAPSTDFDKSIRKIKGMKTDRQEKEEMEWKLTEAETERQRKRQAGRSRDKQAETERQKHRDISTEKEREGEREGERELHTDLLLCCRLSRQVLTYWL